LSTSTVIKSNLKKGSKVNLGLKLLIAGLLSYVIYQQVFSREDAGQLYDNFTKQLKDGEIIFLLLALILMPINWLLESKKWQLLSANFEKQTLKESVKTILGGVVCSLFSPARIGEYGGRILFVKPENNWKAITATMVGSLSQLVIVLSIGSLGLISWLGYYSLANSYALTGFIVLWVFVTLIGLAIYFHVDIFINIIKRVKIFNRFERFYEGLSVLQHYQQSHLTKTLSILALITIFWNKYWFFTFCKRNYNHFFHTNWCSITSHLGFVCPWRGGYSSMG